MGKWTAGDIPDLTGRRVVVTGANSGLGLQTSAALAAHSAEVIMACRDTGRAEEARQFVSARATGPAPEVMTLDLADLASVRTFSDDLARRIDGLDVLVNNAGVMAIPRSTTADGFETQFGTNHLGHFALTALVFPLLRARPGARVVTVSSVVATVGRIDFDDLQGERHYSPWRAYAQSKLANLLFAFELDRRTGRAGVEVISVAAHPGYAATNLQSVGPQAQGSRIGLEMSRIGNMVLAQSAADGALPSLYAAAGGDVQGGGYYGPDGFFQQRGHPTKVKPPRQAGNTVTARSLWTVSESLVGVTFPVETTAS